jgi:hypothetical protein
MLILDDDITIIHTQTAIGLKPATPWRQAYYVNMCAQYPFIYNTHAFTKIL